MRFTAAIIASAIAAPALALGEPEPEIVRTFRTTSYTIDAHLGQLAQSTAEYDVRLAFEHRLANPFAKYYIPGPSQSLDLGIQTGSTGVYANSTGDVDLRSVAFDHSNPQNLRLGLEWEIGTLHEEGLIQGSVGFGYQMRTFEIGDNTNRTPTLESSINGDNREVLSFDGGGNGLVGPNDSHTLYLELSGHWDPDGTGEGSVDFRRLHQSYTITQFFEYDAVRDVTYFSAFTEFYLRRPGLQFDLVGAVVPAPAGIVCLSAGFAFAGRRRRLG